MLGRLPGHVSALQGCGLTLLKSSKPTPTRTVCKGQPGCETDVLRCGAMRLGGAGGDDRHRTMLTVLSLDHLLEILLGFLFHDGLAGTNICTAKSFPLWRCNGLRIQLIPRAPP